MGMAVLAAEVRRHRARRAEVVVAGVAAPLGHVLLAHDADAGGLGEAHPLVQRTPALPVRLDPATGALRVIALLLEPL